MSTIEETVAAHYTTGNLTERFKAAMRAVGLDPATARVDHLKAGDEFHTAGIEATDHFFQHFQIAPTDRVVDVGSGIGGTSRYIAHRFGAQVTGVDLTPEFVETSRALSDMVGVGDKVDFHVGSALNMPVADAACDVAVMMHVGMNIADKPALFAEVARVLKPGGTFAVFDVMKGPSDVPPVFPLPWSTVADTSFLHAPDAYAAAARAAGFDEQVREDRSAFAEAFFDAAFAKIASDGPSPFGIGLMMGETAPVKFQNYVTNLKSGRLGPVEMVFRKHG